MDKTKLMHLVYDGSFEGFLSLVYDVYYQKIYVASIAKNSHNLGLLDDFLEITSSDEKAKKVLDAIKQKFSKKHYEFILNIFLCDSVGFEKSLLEFVVIGFKNQRELENINQSCVFYLRNLEREFFRHYHKMSGFIRFVELGDGTLYAQIKPKFDICFYLGKHFAKRFNNQNYIIHDLERKIAFVKIGDKFSLEQIAFFDSPDLSQNEAKFQNLWRTFFENVSISERKNKKLQTQMVPLYYRELMTEFV